MKKIGAFEAKTHLSQILSDIEKKEDEIIIQKRGKNVAVLISFNEFTHLHEHQKTSQILDGFREIRMSQKSHSGKHAPDIKSLIDMGRKR